MTRNIPTEKIRLSQINIVDPENHYKHIFKVQVELPADVSPKDRLGILRSSGRCTVERAVEAGPEFVTEGVESLDADAQALLTVQPDSDASTRIAGKDLPLQHPIVFRPTERAVKREILDGEIGLASSVRQRPKREPGGEISIPATEETCGPLYISRAGQG